ncbi:MAG: lanthionine synthetase LanC family protein [Candidatus Kariarchaeaceae archaeon]|jgi:hypothetical protein
MSLLPPTTTGQEQQEQLQVLANEFLEHITRDIIDNMKNDSIGSVGWDIAIGTTDEDIYATGYHLGTAGIFDILLSLKEKNYDVPEAVLDEIVLMYDQRKIAEDIGYSWTRYLNITKGTWTGYRYGSAGILPTLVRYENMSFGQTGDLVEEGYRWLQSMIEFGGNYVMGPGGYTTTDVAYGSSGIGKSYLEMYQMTSNMTYLESAINIADWLVEISVQTGGGLFLPWSVSEGGESFDNEFYFGYQDGIAGTLSFLIDIFEITGDIRYKEAIDGYSEYLISHELNGQWDDGGSPYLVPTRTRDGLIGIYHGSAGIGLTLLRAHAVTNSSSIPITLERILNNIESLITQSGDIWASLVDKDAIAFTGYGHGAAGVADFYLYMYETFGKTHYLQQVDTIINRLWNMYESDGQLLIQVDEEEEGISMNHEFGLAGIATTLLHIIDLQTPDIVVSETDPANVPRQVDPTVRNILIALGVLVPVILLRIRRINVS